MVVHRVEIDIQEVGIAVVVAAREPARDERRLAVVHPCPDVHRLVVVGDPQFGPLGRRLAFVGILLGEAGGSFDTLPRLVVEAPVDHGGVRHAHSCEGGARCVSGTTCPAAESARTVAARPAAIDTISGRIIRC